MADRYWVGGTGSWTTTNTANWSASSGGSSGASVPTATDNVIFDSGSGATGFTVTVGTAVVCLDLTVTNTLAAAMILAGTFGITVSGSLSFPLTNFSTTHSGSITFNATTAKTITTNGVTLASGLIFNGAAGSWAMQTAVTTTGTTTLTIGTLNLNSFTLTCSTMSAAAAIGFGASGSIVVTGSGSIWSSTSALTYTGTSNITISNNTAIASSVVTGAAAESRAMNFNFINGSYALTLTTGNGFKDINFTGFTGTLALTTSTITCYGNLTYNGTMTTSATTGGFYFNSLTASIVQVIRTNGLTVNHSITLVGGGTNTLQLFDNFTQGSTNNFTLSNGTLDINSKTMNAGVIVITASHTIINGTIRGVSVTHTSGPLSIGATYNLLTTGAYTLTAGTITINDSATLSVGSFVSTNTNTRTLNFGTGSITTTGTGTVWNVTGVTGLTFTGTSNIIISNNTATAVTVTNTASATSAMNFNFINGTYTLTLTTGNSYRNLNFTGFAGTVGFVATTHTMYGNLNLGSTATTSATAGTSTLTWNSTSGTRTITSNGRTSNFGIALNGVGQTLQLADAFVQGTTQTFAYTNGTFDLATYSTSVGVLTITTGTHTITNGTLNCANVTHTSGDLTVSSTATVACTGTYTFTAGTINIGNSATLSTGLFSSANANARSIAFNTSGILAITSSGTVWNTSTVTSFSYTGTSNVRLTYSGAVAVTITSGAMSAAQALNFAITAGTYSLTTTTASVFNNLDFTGFSGTYTQAATAISVYGNLVFSSAMSYSAVSSGAISMIATSGTKTITSNGDVIGCNLNFNSVGGIFQLADAFSQLSTASFTVTNGTVDLNNQSYSIGILNFASGTGIITNYGATLSAASVIQNRALTLGTGGYPLTTTGDYQLLSGALTLASSFTLSVGSFSSNNANTRSIVFGASSAIQLTGTGTVFNMGTAAITGFSYSGTSSISLVNSGATATSISSGQATAAQALNFNITAGTYTLTFGSNSAFNNLDFTGFSGIYSQGALGSSVYGNLVFSASMTTTGGGPSGAMNMSATSGTKTITTNGISVNCNISFNGVGGTFQLADSFLQTSNAYLYFRNGTIDFNNKTYTIGVLDIGIGTGSYINYGGTLSPSAVVHTSGAVTIDTGALITTTGSYTFTAGTITINSGVTLSVGSFNSANVNTRVIAFGTGSIKTTGTGTVWNVTGVTGLTFTGTSNITIDNNTATAVTVTNTAGSASAMSFNFINGTYTLTLTTGNSYRNLNFTGFAGTVSFSLTTHTMYGNLNLGSTATTSATAGTNTLTWNSATAATGTITSNGRTANFGINVNGAGQILQFIDAFSQAATQLLTLTSGTIDLNSQTVSAGVLVVVTAAARAITNTGAAGSATLQCANVTHTSGTLTVNTTATVTCTGTYTFTAGTISIANGVTLSVGLFSSNNANVRSITYNTSGILAITGTGTVWNTSTVTNFSYTGTSNVRLTNSGSTATTITTGAMSAAQAQNFNITAGTYTLTLTTANVYNNLNFTGFTGTVAFVATTHTMYGNLTLGSGMTTSATPGTNTLLWNSTVGTRTITSNGVTANFGISLNGVGQTLQLADAFVQGSTQNFAYTNGTFDLATYSASVGILTITTGTHAISNGTLNCTTVTHTSGDLTVSTTATVAASSTYTFSAGTINIGNGATLSVGAFTSSGTGVRSIAYNTSGELRLTSSGTVWNTSTVTNFSYTGTSNVRLTNSGSTATTITAGAMSAAQAQNFYVTAGTYTLTTTTGGVMNTLDFTGFSGTYAQAATSITLYGNLVYSATMATTTTSGSGFIIFAATSGTDTITTNGSTINNNIRFNGVGGTTQLADTFTQGSTSYFSIVNGTVDFNNVTYSLGILEFQTGTSSYTNYGGTLSAASIIHTSGTVTTGTGALIYTVGTYTFTAGTIQINNGVDLTVGALSSPGSSTRVINFGTGKIKIIGTSSTTIINFAAVTGFSFTGTGNLTIDTSTSNALTLNFLGTSSNVLDVNVVSGTTTIDIVNGSNFRNLDFTGFTGTLSTGTNTCTLYGNLVLGSAMTTSATAGTNTFIWNSTSGTRTITSNGITANFGIYLNGIGQTLQLTDTFTQGTTQTFAYTNGTLDINSQSVTLGTLVVTTVIPTIINPVSSTLNCANVTHTSGNLTVSSTLNLVCSGTYTFTAGSITINNDVSLKVGIFSSNNSGTRSIAFGTAGKIEITGNNTTVCNLATTTGFSFTGTSNLTFSYAGSTGTRTIATGTGLSGGSALTLRITAGTDVISFTNAMTVFTVDFTGFSGTWANVAIVMSGYLLMSTTMTASAGANALTWSYTVGNRYVQSNGITLDFPIILSTSVGTTFQFFDTFVQGSTREFRLTNGTLDINSQSVTLGNFTILTGTHAISNGTLNCDTVTHTSGDLTVSTTATVVTSGVYTFTAGTINIGNGATLSANSFSSSNSNVRSIAFNTSGILAITGTGTVWNTSTVTNFSYTGTSNVRLTNSGSTATTITTGAMSSTQALNFNITAGTYTLTTTTGSAFNTLDFTGFSGVYDQGTDSISLYNNLVFSSGMTGTTTSGAISMAATAGTKTITTNGATIGNSINFNGVGGTFQLADAFSQSSTASFIITNGTVDFNSQTYSIGILTFVSGTNSYINYGGTLSAASILHTSGTVTTGTGALLTTAGSYTFTAGTITINNSVELNIGSFLSNNTNTRVIAFGTGSIKTTGSGLVWNLAGITGFTLSGTPTVNISNNTATAATVTATAANTNSSINFNFINGTYTLTLTTGNSYRSLNFTGFAGTIDFNTTTHAYYGDLTLGSATVSSATPGTNTITYSGIGTSQLTTNGAIVNFGINFTSGTIQLNDSFTQGSTQVLTFAGAGNLSTNNKVTNAGSVIISTPITSSKINTSTYPFTCASLTQQSSITLNAACKITCTGVYTHLAGTITLQTTTNGSYLNMGSYTQSGSTIAKAIAFGTAGASITLTGSGLLWDSIETGFSYTGTSYIIVTNPTTSSASLRPATTSDAKAMYFFISGGGNYTLSLLDGAQFLGLDFADFVGTLDLGTASVTNYGDFQLTNSTTMTTSSTTGTMTFIMTTTDRFINTAGRTINFNITINSTAAALILTTTTGGFVTISPSNKLTLIRGYVYLSNALYGTKTISVGTLDITTDYTYTTKTLDFTRGLISITGTSGTILTSTNTNYVGTPNFNIDSTATSGTISVGFGSTEALSPYYSFNIRSGSYTIQPTSYSYAGVGALSFTGFSGTLSLVNPLNITGNITLSSTMSMSGTESFTFGSGSSSIVSNGVTFTQSLVLAGGSVTLGSAFITTNTNGIIHTTGSLITANYSLTTPAYTINSGTKTITLGTSTVSITGIGDAWNVVSATGITLNRGTSTISMTGTSAKNFIGGGLTYYNLNQGAAAALTISGNNTFNDIKNTVRPSTVTITSGSTQTVSAFTLSGTSGNLVTLNSSTPASAATLSKATGTVGVSYLSITDSTATGGAIWNALISSGNINNGGNSGWNFGALVVAAIGAFFAFF